MSKKMVDSKMIDYRGQMTLDFSPGYRKGQLTSKLADDTKLKATQCQYVYTAIRNFCNGGTSREIARFGKIPYDVVWRRMHDLVENEYIREGEPRKCTISGRMVKTWWLI